VIDRADVELARTLERCAVLPAAFHHADHLRVAWVYLNESPTIEAAIARMAATLRRFAASAGAPDKYSDAITAFWMYQLAATRALMPDADCATVLRAYPRLLDKTAVLAYYSEDVSSPRTGGASGDPPDRPLPGGAR
jgi:hypothetical protein